MSAVLGMLINGRRASTISATNRGLAYGDGLFETVGMRGRRPTLWEEHYRRLVRGGEILGIKIPAAQVLERELRRVCGQGEDAVGKIIVTRGEGGRGYLPPKDAEPERLVMAFPWPQVPATWFVRGVRVRVCQQRVTEQPALAGLKHLNRLDSVLARSEWRSSRIAEGLMLDSAGHVIEGTASNLLAVFDGELVTPKLDRCGVAGAMRAWLMANYAVREVRFKVEDLRKAEGAAMCNSIHGVWPVRTIDGIGSLDVSIIKQKIHRLPWSTS